MIVVDTSGRKTAQSHWSPELPHFLRSRRVARALLQLGVASPSTTYQPRQPAQGVLHQLVREHFETFRAQAVNLHEGDGLPGFVEQEFRNFLQCGSPIVSAGCQGPRTGITLTRCARPRGSSSFLSSSCS